MRFTFMEMRMGAMRFFLLLCLFLIIASANVFGGGFAFDGIGVKANGMGGAFRAIADDWSAAYYNPAGYYQIQDNQFAFNSAFFHNRYWITPNVYWNGDSGEEYETGFFNGQEIANKHAVPHCLQGGILARLPIFENEMVMGLAIYSLYNQNQNWELMQLIPAYNTHELPGNQFGIKLDGTAYQLTFATGFMEDKLSVGVGLSLVRADLIYNNIVLRDNPMPAPISDRPYDKVPEYYKNEGDGLGYGFRMGLLYDVTEKMKVGATVSSVTSIDINGRSWFEFYMGQNSNTTVYDTQLKLEELLFMEGKVIKAVSDFKTSMDLPATVGGGIAYQVNDKLTLSLDAEMVFWSKFKGFDFDFSNFEADGGLNVYYDNKRFLTDTIYDRAQEMFFTDLSAPIAWKDAEKVMLGANYKATNFLDLRAGFSADKSAIDWSNTGGITQNPQFIDLGTKYSYSFGFNFDIDIWSLEFATTYTHQPDCSISTKLYQDSDNLMDNITALYSGDNFRTILGLNYRF